MRHTPAADVTPGGAAKAGDLAAEARYRFRPIGLIHSCFTEKFGIPRQPGLIPEAEATLELLSPFDRDEAVRGLEGFNHM